MKVIIAYGLPGSGKTFYGRQMEERLEGIHIELDRPAEEGGPARISEVLTPEILSTAISRGCLYVDSLVTTNRSLLAAVGETWEALLENGFDENKTLIFEILAFQGTREQCIRNVGRRNDGRNVDVSVGSMPYEVIDDRKLENEVQRLGRGKSCRIVERKVWDDDIWDNHFQPLLDGSRRFTDGKTLIYSDDWSLGGTWGDCWGNSGTISADDEPKDFKEFDSLLETVCPNITFLQYKSIFENCVDKEQWNVNDYYGGFERRCRFRADIAKLYAELKRRGIIGQ